MERRDIDLQNLATGVTKAHGFLKPSALILALPEGVGTSISENLRTILRDENPIDFVNPNVFEFFDDVLTQGDRVRIWTDDYLLRVGCVIGAYRRELPEQIRKNLSASSHHEDKLLILPQLLRNEHLRGVRSFGIIDDCSENLNRATEIFTDLNLEGGELRTYNLSIEEVLELRKQEQDVFSSVPRESVSWFVDFNDVIIDKSSYQSYILEKANRVLAQDCFE